MKIRQGFVSNSSSSSFVIDLKDLTDTQIKQIQAHIFVGLDLGMFEYQEQHYNQKHIKMLYPGERSKREASLKSYFRDEWSITIKNDNLYGSTHLDNFDMDSFLTKIGVDLKKVKWNEQ